MTPSSDTNSVTTIRAAISRSPLLQLVAYRLLLTPEHLHSPGRRRRGTLRSALDPVVHVGDAVLPLEVPGALQLDLLGSEALEQTAPLAEEHRDDMELDLVEDAGSERELPGSGAVDQHVLYARSLLGLSHRTRDVGHIGDQRPLPHIIGVVEGEDKDRHAIVVVAAPAISRLEGPPAGDDRAGRHELVEDLAVDAAQTAGGLGVIGARRRPIVQAFPAVTQAVGRSLIGPGQRIRRGIWTCRERLRTRRLLSWFAV